MHVIICLCLVWHLISFFSQKLHATHIGQGRTNSGGNPLSALFMMVTTIMLTTMITKMVMNWRTCVCTFCPPLLTRFILSSLGFCAREIRPRYDLMILMMTIMWMISCWETRTKYPQNVDCRWQTRPDRWLPILNRRPSLDSNHETTIPPTLSQAENFWIQCNMRVKPLSSSKLSPTQRRWPACQKELCNGSVLSSIWWLWRGL